MFKFPSIPSAMIAGAISFPLLAWGSAHIHNQLLLLWMLFIFFPSVIVSAVGINYLKHCYNFEDGFFTGLRRSLKVEADDEYYAIFFFPMLVRIGFWFFSGVISLFALTFSGILVL
jgi:hypothetical protein